jgi:hypothetical protein
LRAELGAGDLKTIKHYAEALNADVLEGLEHQGGNQSRRPARCAGKKKGRKRR